MGSVCQPKGVGSSPVQQLLRSSLFALFMSYSLFFFVGRKATRGFRKYVIYTLDLLTFNIQILLGIRF